MSDTKAEPDRPALTLSIEIRVETTTRVDLVEFYLGLSESGRDEYKAMDPKGFTDPGEHNWPIEFIVPDETVGVALDVMPVLDGDGVRHDLLPSEDVDTHLSRHPRQPDSKPYWNEADFDLLCSKVPWLAEFHRSRIGKSECATCGEPIYERDEQWEHVNGGWVTDHRVEPREPTIEEIIREKSGRVA